ncbi:dihydrolipoyl dehydrogenase [Aureliella helgolandensis]|uniref:Dihydrolipoyl dehydrogenase n=1 Tax=Aureliella helgolandensis TaxID=2527968 RepID=A0A518G215_9BACT|nr:dihydrolipoyl dehydrogenase [Aureliella helgolandensis]QDV22648.1 Dihydrolipoyl dehydrogenase [Aureliella helgolandensis]
MKRAEHDVVVIGGGPGGYVAAIRAAQLGFNTACIDENEVFGGTCLRVGCIPSKALLESSHLYHVTQSQLGQHGVQVGSVGLDLSAMLARKDKVVSQLTGGVTMLLKRNKITAYHGRGKLSSVDTVAVETAEGPLEIRAKHIVLATGSRPATMRGVEYDGDRIGDSTTALNYPEVPKRLVVIGGGYIGLELGSVWNRLGSQVTVLEAMDRVLPGLDHEIGQLAHREFQKQGIEFRTGSWVEGATFDGKKCTVQCKGSEPIECDRVLLSTGRVPCSDDLGLDGVGIETDRRGFVPVDENFQTAVQGVYAVGDLLGGAMLAHKASEEGIVCVERIAGMKSHVNYGAIPAVVYTHPEIASVGQTEEQLKDAGIEYIKGICPYGASGRALALGEPSGRVKVLADAKTDRVLGVHIIGAHAGDLIAEATAAIEFGASSEDIARCCHAHPTLSELLHEAAMAVSKRAIHTA